MIVMIIGFIVLIVFLVTRFPEGPSLTLPETITLPDGTTPIAFTQTREWYGVVTEQDEILIYDKATGSVVQTIQVNIAD